MFPQSFQLVMRSGPTPGKAYTLAQSEMTIGREVGNHIVINDAEVSRKHARLTPQAGGYMIEDLGSTNGTFVNGQRLMGPHMLRHGELITIGENVTLAFEAPQFDQGATLVSGSGEGIPQTVPAGQPPGFYEPAQQDYVGSVPAGPVEPYYPPADVYEAYEQQKPSRVWIYVGAGCLVVLLCVLLSGAIAFDLLDLYCTEPFDAFFNCP